MVISKRLLCAILCLGLGLTSCEDNQYLNVESSCVLCSSMMTGCLTCSDEQELLTNGGFELPAITPDHAVYLSSIDGWILANDVELWSKANRPYEGNQCIDTEATSNVELSQTFATSEGTILRLTLAYTTRTDPVLGTLEVYIDSALIATLADDPDIWIE